VSFLRTVLGDIPATDAGVCYAHEHIIIDRSFATFRYPDFLIDSVEKAVADVLEFRAAGGRTLVDSMPCGGGRNVSKLAEVARQADVNILCPTGLHLSQYYAPGHWSERLDVDALTTFFVDEITTGIDGADGNGPSIERTSHRAGLIKVATGEHGFSERDARIFDAAAAAHLLTGAPVLTHTEQGRFGMEQVDYLRDRGVDPSHVVLSHTDRHPDTGYHRALLATGVALEYDSAFRWATAQGNPTEALVMEMVAAGYGGQILLGMDAARRRYWKSYGGEPGLSFLLTTFVPQLRARGLTDRQVDAIFVDNPGRAYAFAKVAA
jgi:5-phospho-D-xylono-1,4-lactonase